MECPRSNLRMDMIIEGNAGLKALIAGILKSVFTILGLNIFEAIKSSLTYNI
jgi:hypothetical protein